MEVALHKEQLKNFYTSKAIMNDQVLLLEKFTSSRSLSNNICQNLAPEDLVIQSMPDVSPAKWHLAHTTWFYEAMILKEFEEGFEEYHPSYHFLFNSYYKTQGEHWERVNRGLLSRPTRDEIIKYRESINEKIIKLLNSKYDEIKTLVEIGINHEQQHQELMLMDLKHVLGTNPLFPIWHEQERPKSKNIKEEFIYFEGGLKEIGVNKSDNFAFDNETPSHKVYVEDFLISNKLVTNGEYLEFINCNGYSNSELWLSDGWDLKLSSPLYWIKRDDQWYESTPYGLIPLELETPVCHISYFEADAYATWRGLRLPTEAEWEVVSKSLEVSGQFFDTNELLPKAGHKSNEINDMFGVLWQWTSSSYQTYPKYKRPSGSLGEYNAKFTNGQRVLRGGSFATLKDHFRTTYRNFYQPEKRWPFTGVRLAKNKE